MIFQIESTYLDVISFGEIPKTMNSNVDRHPHLIFFMKSVTKAFPFTVYLLPFVQEKKEKKIIGVPNR